MLHHTHNLQATIYHMICAPVKLDVLGHEFDSTFVDWVNPESKSVGKYCIYIEHGDIFYCHLCKQKWITM